MRFLFILLLLLFIDSNKAKSFLNIPFKFFQKSVSKENNKKMVKVCLINGGSTSSENNSNQNISVVVSTSFGSNFLDKNKKILIRFDSNIFDLKQQLQSKFPGSPPISLQKLYFGVRELSDGDIIGNITKFSPIAIRLDIMSGTSIYEKTLSVTQAIDGYVASIVQQTFVGDSIRQLFTPENNLSNITNSELYREIFHKMNESIYEKYADDIRVALEEEKDPETASLDTIAWRQSSTSNKNPLMKALAKEFDINFRGVKYYLYLSGLIGVSL